MVQTSEGAGGIPQRETDATDEAILSLLRRAPEPWAELEVDALSAVEEEALRLLTAAGLIERKFSFRLSLIGQESRIEVTARASGEYGLVRAMEPVLGKAWEVWSDVYRQGRDGPEEDRPALLCEPTAPQQWRLSEPGAGARKDLEAGNARTVLDFARRRPPVFSGKVVPGDGRTERLEAVSGEPGPPEVKVTNLEEVAGPMREVARTLQAGLEKMAAMREQGGRKQTSESPPAEPARKKGRPRASARQAEKRYALLARWTEAKESGVSREQFCDTEGIAVEELNRIRDWAYRRRRRGQA